MHQHGPNKDLNTQKGNEGFLENSTDAIFALNQEWQFIYLNVQAERHLAKSRDELLGMNIWEVFPRLINTPFYTNYCKAMQELTAVGFEEFFVPLNAWFEVRVFPFEGGLTVYFRDISESKRRIESINEGKERYSSLFHNGHIVMFLVDSEANCIIDVNEAACNFYGYSKEDFLKIKISDLKCNQDNNNLKCSQTQTYLRHRLANGEVRDVEVYCTPITIKGSKLFYIIIYDITERKNVEHALIESEKKFRKLFQDANDAIFLHSYLDNGMPDKFLEVNDTACKIFGYTKEEFLDISPIELDDQENSEELEQTSKKVVKSGNTTFERILMSKKDKKFLLNLILIFLS